MRRSLALLGLYVALMGPLAADAAAVPGPSPQTTQGHAIEPASNIDSSLSPALSQALRQLGSPDFAQRQAGTLALQRALAAQVSTLVSTPDPEIQSRLAELMEFQLGLTRWASDMLQMPREKRETLLELGLRPEVLPHLARSYADRPAARRDAIRELAKLEGDAITDLLASKVDEVERPVYIAAMEALWDRPATPAAVDALWRRAVDAGFAMYRTQRNMPEEQVTFRGRNLGNAGASDNAAYRRSQDGGVACDVLVHLKSPLVGEKLLAQLSQIEDAFNGKGQDRNNQWTFTGVQEPMKNLSRLVRAFRPREAVPIIYRLATREVTQRSTSQVNGAKFFWSNRTWALGLLYELTDRSPEDLSMMRMPSIPELWTVGTEAQEDQLVSDLKTWWSQNSGRYAVESATRPAD